MNNINIDELFYTLRLARTSGIGNASAQVLLRKYGTAEYIINNFYSIAEINPKIKLANIEDIEKEITDTLNINGNFIYWNHPNYPRELKQYYDMPVIFIYAGNIELLTKCKISIVGSRYPSMLGLQFCHQISSELSSSDYAIVSGMAEGIDTRAHLSTQSYKTIAILATGINICYPNKNIELFNNIKQSGLLITEKPLYTKPLAQFFPKRNNIIAALGSCTIVVESQIGSSALITANAAHKYGKIVYAVPSHPLDKKYNGNNFILQKYARILLSTADIINNQLMLYDYIKELKDDNFISNKILIDKILNDIPITGINIDQFIDCCMCTYKISHNNVIYILGLLELDGKISILSCKLLNNI